MGKENGSEYGHGTDFQPKNEVPVGTEGLNRLEKGCLEVFCAHAADEGTFFGLPHKKICFFIKTNVYYIL